MNAMRKSRQGIIPYSRLPIANDLPRAIVQLTYCLLPTAYCSFCVNFVCQSRSQRLGNALGT